MSFPKTIKIIRVRRRFEVFEKPTIFFKLQEKPCYYLLIKIPWQNYAEMNVYACVTCKIIYSLLIFNFFSPRKIICQNDRSKTKFLITKTVKISKIALHFLFWHCISFKLHYSQPIRIDKCFHVYHYISEIYHALH